MQLTSKRRFYFGLCACFCCLFCQKHLTCCAITAKNTLPVAGWGQREACYAETQIHIYPWARSRTRQRWQERCTEWRRGKKKKKRKLKKLGWEGISSVQTETLGYKNCQCHRSHSAGSSGTGKQKRSREGGCRLWQHCWRAAAPDGHLIMPPGPYTGLVKSTSPFPSRFGKFRQMLSASAWCSLPKWSAEGAASPHHQLSCSRDTPESTQAHRGEAVWVGCFEYLVSLRDQPVRHRHNWTSLIKLSL